MVPYLVFFVGVFCNAPFCFLVCSEDNFGENTLDKSLSISKSGLLSPGERQQDGEDPNKKDAGRETHEDTGGEILGRRSARRPGNNPQNNTEQDQQYADTSFPAAPELLPYPCDGLLKRTISLHIANNLSCAYIKSNPFTSFLPHP